jgi:hypothetical protein
MFRRIQRFGRECARVEDVRAGEGGSVGDYSLKVICPVEVDLEVRMMRQRIRNYQVLVNRLKLPLRQL